PIPGTSTTGVLAGVYTANGRQQLELSFGYNQYQLQYRYLAHGIVDWVTKGVHFGYWRNYFTVHIDDVFNADAIWSTAGDCTPGADTCPPGTPDTTPARMVPADVTAVANWEKANNFTLDMLYNGGAEANFVVNGKDPLLTALQQAKNSFRWVNHTYSHEFLGCQQDFSVFPWKCVTDASGNTVWVSSADINSQIGDNIKWAQQHGFPVNRGELVAGEHSGTLILPQQPIDNPNFDGALGGQGVKFTGLDASREPAMRPVGAAYGLPRHPVDVYYNVSTVAEEVSEYNWIYTSKANGGSGICETTPGVSCIAPLDPATGWSSYILPLQQKIMLGFVVSNDERPFYMHQPNLTDDRLTLSVLTGVLHTYRGVYTHATPVVNGRMIDAGDAMLAQNTWAQTESAGTVSGYVQGDTVTITGPAGTQIPFTAPNGTTIGSASGSAFGAAYGGERSNYLTQQTTGSYGLVLKTTPYTSAATPTASAPKVAASKPLAPNTSAAKKAVAKSATPAMAPVTGN
ncbi:MAG: hypothetical protein J2O49_05700, partial [Sciscionella sp.]|nr:hypothetical protein [Sciscionella sp.]